VRGLRTIVVLVVVAVLGGCASGVAMESYEGADSTVDIPTDWIHIDLD
jgi:hypothetical protein